jgi:hypothetical protein
VANQIRLILDGLNRVAEQVIRKVALDVVANLVAAPPDGGTPVDTGWARSNWLINLTVPVTQPVGSKQSVQPLQPNSGGILGYRLTHGPVYISNNVPYISLLNNGSSRQAPAGFVQRAIHKAVTIDLIGLKVA